MNIYAAASLFALLILLYWIISEVFTVLFRLIGLPEEKARFQVISMLTGAGFTTRESEMIISTRSRRRMAKITMLFGFVFNVTIVSAFVNIFKQAWTRHHRVRLWLDHRIEAAADRWQSGPGVNGITVVDQIGDQTIARVTLHTVPEAYQNKPLSKMDIKRVHGILVLMVEHENGEAEQATAQTEFTPHDKLTVFGDYNIICTVLQARERFTDD